MAQTICTHLLNSRNRNPEWTAFSFKEKRSWKTKTWPEFFSDVEQLAGGLMSQFLKAGDRIAILSNTCYEWTLLDMAALGSGAAVVPIYPNLLASEIEYILNDAQVKYLFVENDSQKQKWLAIKKNCPSTEACIVFDSKEWTQLFEKGKKFLKTKPDAFVKSIESVQMKDLATIIYTSGTSGRPKGVVLSHKQVASSVGDTFPLMGLNHKDTTLSFLPYAHVFGRVEMWGCIFSGYHLAFAESIDRIKGNFLDVKPTAFICVPRILEKIQQGVMNQVAASPVQNQIFKWAMDIGHQMNVYRNKKTIPPIALIAKNKMADQLVFKKIRDKMGGRLRFAVCGGAALRKEVAEFFQAIDVTVLEGYGLTETTAVVTVNRPFDNRVGTVGKPVGDVEIKIAEDGEVLVKSEHVMKSYYNDEASTKEVTVDDYFATGDIGELSWDGYLRILDRKKDLIKTAGGKYVVPQKLESLLQRNQLIAHALIHGESKKYVVALLSLDHHAVKNWFNANGLSFNEKDKEWINHPKLRTEVQNIVVAANQELSSFETIKSFDILPQEFTVENGALTPSLKVKRKLLDQKYRAEIEQLYSLSDSSTTQPNATH